ncbi:MAG TPA: M57 family metalloprotease [Myxococcus sp.]|nr:M57 family metalloprotease [Myxococcus sp.]
MRPPAAPPPGVHAHSIMNSCYRSTETGEFTSTDVTAFTVLYGRNPRRALRWQSGSERRGGSGRNGSSGHSTSTSSRAGGVQAGLRVVAVLKGRGVRSRAPGGALAARAALRSWARAARTRQG